MKSIKTIFLLIAGIGLSSVAFAQQGEPATMTKSQTATTTTKSAATTAVQKGDRTSYRAAKKQADATYKTAKSQCDAMGMKDKGSETCVGVAKAQQKLDKANAEAMYKDTAKNRTNAHTAAAELDYAKAKVQCHSLPGDVKETGIETTNCLNKAAEARNQAVAAAKAQKKAATK